MKIISQADIENLLTHKYPEESFKKFNDHGDPLYQDYKDRKIEEALDRGFNLGIEHAARLLGDCRCSCLGRCHVLSLKDWFSRKK